MKNYKRILCFLCLGLAIILTLSACGYTMPMTRRYPLTYGLEGTDSSLMVIRESNDRYGYMDAMGNKIIALLFEEAYPFSDGLAVVKKGGKYGYIDKTGKTVIPFRYLDAYDFHNGVAVVGKEIDRSGPIRVLGCMIDQEGKEITATDIFSFKHLSEGTLLYTKNGDYLYDALTRERTQLLNLDLAKAIGYSCGHSIVNDSETSYFVDQEGNKAFGTSYREARPFSENLAAVIPMTEKDKWGYINQQGQLVIPAKYKRAFDFGEGVACVRTTDDIRVIIDRQANVLTSVSAAFDTAQSFSDGLCAVGRDKEETVSFNYVEETYDWGFIDTTGKLVIDFQYDLVTPFKNGIAQVLVDGKIGYIDKTGKYIWEPQ